MTGGPGWHIDPLTLREVVTEPELLTTQLQAAPAADRIWLLRLLGRLEQSAAEGEALLLGCAPSPARVRPLVLLGHTRSWQRRWERAAVLHAEALGLAEGTHREAAVRQHWGKCLFEQQRYDEALEQFVLALELRRAAGASEELVESSAMAVRRTRALLTSGDGAVGGSAQTRPYRRSPASPRPGTM